MPPKRKAVADAEARNAANAPAEKTAKKSKGEKLPKFEEFEKVVKPLKVTITTHDGKKLASFDAPAKTFTTKSYGFGGNAHLKIDVEIDGEQRELAATCTVNVPISGSKKVGEEESNGDE